MEHVWDQIKALLVIERMLSWSTTTLLLCLYGFLKELRPSEPFLTEYLIDKNYVNITLQEAYYDVYPVWTYSYLAVLVLTFLVTDFLRYKPVIIVEGIAYIVTWSLLVWGSGVPLMQFMQFTYGTATSTEIAYYTYIYAKVDRKHYQKVTSFTRASFLMGRFLSSVIAQLLVSFNLMDFHGLNYFSLASVTLATLVAICLPSIDTSIYFHNPNTSETEPLQQDQTHESAPRTNGQGPHGTDSLLKVALQKVWQDFKASFGNKYVRKWSFWWALGMCGNFQVGNYIQPLWETIQPVEMGNINIYNGAVEAAATLTGAILAFAFGYLHLNWRLIGEPVLSLLSLIHGVILIVMAMTEHITVAYIGYWAFRALFQMLITVASFEVARNIGDDSYGLVFGFNTFLALLFQTILTVIVADDAGLALPPRTQFMVYGGFWIFIGIIYVSMFIYEVVTKGIGSFISLYREEGIWVAPPGDNGNDTSSRRDVPMGSTEPQ